MQNITKYHQPYNQNNYVAQPIQQTNPNSQYNHPWQRSDTKFQSAIQNYQKQNQQIDQTNKQLAARVRQMQHKENILLDQIRILSAQFQSMKSLADNKENSNLNKISKRDSKISTQASTYFGGSTQSFTDQQERFQVPQNFENRKSKTWKKMETINDVVKIKNLSQDFSSLIQESLKEEDPIKKKQLRRQLAQLALQIKKIKNDPQPLSNQYGLTTCETPNSLNTKKNNFTSSKLSPYLSLYEHSPATSFKSRKTLFGLKTEIKERA